jgi:hypothetical protein
MFTSGTSSESQPNGRFAFGRVLHEGVVGVYLETSSDSDAVPERTDRYRFAVGVYRDVLTSGEWPVVAHLEAEANDDWPPPLAVVDVLGGPSRVYERGVVREPRVDEDPDSFEPVAAWDRHHVIERIIGTRHGPFP